MILVEPGDIERLFYEAAIRGKRTHDNFAVWADWSAWQIECEKGRNARHYSKNGDKLRADSRARMQAKAPKANCQRCGRAFGIRSGDGRHCGPGCKAAAFRESAVGIEHAKGVSEERLRKSRDRRRAKHEAERARRKEAA